MHTSNVWLSISLFCQSSYWSDLLIKGVQPFVDALQNEGRLLHFHIALNRERGDNVRLALLVQSNDAEEIAMYVDYYFKLYFSNFPNNRAVPETRRNVILMDFPFNSIRYGLFHHDQHLDKLYGDPPVQQVLSALILEAAKDEPINEKVILMLAFSLYLTMADVIVRFSEVSFEQLLHVPVRPVSNNNGTQIVPSILTTFEYGRGRMFDLAYDILKQDEPLPDWCRKWRRLCEQKINDPVSKDTAAVYHFYNQMSYFVDIQLGLDNYVKFMIFSLIKSSTTIFC